MGEMAQRGKFRLSGISELGSECSMDGIWNCREDFGGSGLEDHMHEVIDHVVSLRRGQQEESEARRKTLGVRREEPVRLIRNKRQ